MKTDPESEATAYAVGIGIVLVQACALFPGMLACVLLLLPLVLPLLVLGLVAGIVAAPIYGIRRLGAWALARRNGGEPEALGHAVRQHAV